MNKWHELNQALATEDFEGVRAWYKVNHLLVKEQIVVERAQLSVPCEYDNIRYPVQIQSGGSLSPLLKHGYRIEVGEHWTPSQTSVDFYANHQSVLEEVCALQADGSLYYRKGFVEDLRDGQGRYVHVLLRLVPASEISCEFIARLSYLATPNIVTLADQSLGVHTLDTLSNLWVFQQKIRLLYTKDRLTQLVDQAIASYEETT